MADFPLPRLMTRGYKWPTAVSEKCPSRGLSFAGEFISSYEGFQGVQRFQEYGDYVLPIQCEAPQ